MLELQNRLVFSLYCHLAPVLLYTATSKLSDEIIGHLFKYGELKSQSYHRNGFINHNLITLMQLPWSPCPVILTRIMEDLHPALMREREKWRHSLPASSLPDTFRPPRATARVPTPLYTTPALTMRTKGS